MTGLLPKLFLAIGRHALTKQQPRLQPLQLQNFIPVASTNFTLVEQQSLHSINSCQQSMLYGSSQVWSEEKIFLSIHLIKSFQHVWNLPVEKIFTVEACESTALHVCYRRVLLNLTHVIIIIRFIIHKELYNWKKEKYFFSWYSLFIY